MRKFLWLLTLGLAGCALPPQVPPPAPPAEGPARAALPFEAWTVSASRLEVRVYRDGPMQRLGHNHVITTDAIAGVVQLREPLSDTGFALELPLASLVVDDPDARAAAGPDFEAPVPDRDRGGTLHNLLGPGVLDAERQPVLSLTLDRLTGGPQDFQGRVRIGLRGEERVIDVPLSVQFDGERLQAHANLHLHHADLGLVPFSVALGALSVRDDIELDCRIEARRTT